MLATFTLVNRIGDGLINTREVVFDLFLSIHRHADYSKAQPFGWDEFKREWRWWYSVHALFTLMIVVTLALFVIVKVPLGDLSVFTGLVKVGGLLIHLTTGLRQTYGEIICSYAFFSVVMLIPNYLPTLFGQFSNITRGLTQYAMNEEVLFRSGSETWGILDKIRSCVSFGLVHLTMLFVPIGATPSLMLVGAAFMGAYLVTYKVSNSKDKALRVSASLHATYNIMVIPCVLTGLLIYLIFR